MKNLTQPHYHGLVLIVLLCLLSACSPNNENQKITRGVYWWKGDVDGYRESINPFLPWLKDTQIQKIYFKLYDVDWNKVQGIYPADGPFESRHSEMMDLYYQFIPCIFITNQVFENATESELTILADRLVSKIEPSAKEYQIDCDWSAKTKDKYFFFLNTIQKKLPKMALSVTIRLYQYKYPEKTGVPPASKGALMLYNFSSPKNYSDKNSIFDTDEAKKYITEKPYPLKLDFILPSFSWSVLYENREFTGLLHDLSRADIAGFCTQMNENMFKSKGDTVIQGYYIRKGNIIKVEDINNKRLTAAKKLIREFSNTDDYTIAIFSLTEKTQNLINHEVSESIFGSAK